MNHISTLATFLFIRSPLIQPATLRLIAFAAAGCLALLIAYLMVRLIWRVRWKSQTMTSFVHLRNRGNVHSVIDMGAYSPSRNLKFTYVLDGAALPVRKTVPSNGAIEKPVDPHSSPDRAGQAAAQAPAKPPARDAASTAGGAIAGVQKKAGQLSGITALFIDILATLGSILPGPLGESLKKKSSQLQAQKAAIKAKGQAPTRGIKQVQHLKGSVGELKEELGQANPPSAQPGGNGVRKDLAPQAPAPVLPASSPALDHLAQPDPARPARGLPCSEYVQLPGLAPAASHCLALRVTPTNPYYRGDSYFWVFTQPQAVLDRQPAETPQLQKTVQQISCSGMPLFFWLLSITLSVVAVVINGAWLYLFVRWLLITSA